MGVHRTDVIDAAGVHLSCASIVCAGDYSDSVRDMVAALKYHGEKQHARALASMCSQVLAEIEPCDLLTWIPTLDAHRESRGFDHAELIARHVGAGMRLPARRLLRRTSAGRQTGRSRTERLFGVGFVANPVVRGRSVCVIDDVCTTGATMAAAAGALLGLGALRVVCVAAAAVPEKFCGKWQTTDGGSTRAH